MYQSAGEWTKPRLCHYEYDMTKAWFIYFDYYTDTDGKIVRKQYRSGLNKHHRKEERMRVGNALRMFLRYKLIAGWNSITNEEPDLAAEPTDCLPNIRLAFARVFELKTSSLKKKGL